MKARYPLFLFGVQFPNQLAKMAFQFTGTYRIMDFNWNKMYMWPWIIPFKSNSSQRINSVLRNTLGGSPFFTGRVLFR